MVTRPPRSTCTDTRFPPTTLFRSRVDGQVERVLPGRRVGHAQDVASALLQSQHRIHHMALGGDTVDEPYLAGVHHAHHAAHAAHHVPHHAAKRVITHAAAHLLHAHAPPHAPL